MTNVIGWELNIGHATIVKINGVTISPEKIILQREKQHCTIFISAHFMRGFTV